VTPHQRLLDRLVAGTLEAEDRAHASSCPACAALLAQGPSEDVVAPAVTSRVLEAAHRELARPFHPWWRWPLALSLANAVVAASAVVFLEPTNWQASTSPHWRLLSTTLVLAALAILGALLTLGPRRRPLALALALAALAPVAVLWAADGRAAGRPFMAGVSCLWTVLALSVVPLAGGAWLLTQSAYAPRRALAVGLVSAGVGLFALQLTCEDGSRAHLLTFHLLPWAALGVAAVLLRRSLPTSSYAP
jgi:hypothetical protein